jgi:hypothetical protein
MASVSTWSAGEVYSTHTNRAKWEEFLIPTRYKLTLDNTKDTNYKTIEACYYREVL